MELRDEVGLPLKSPEFMSDDFMDDSSEPDEFCNEEEQLFDTCCSICDNGGDILCCEGPCMRSFHATEASGEGSCESLRLSEAEVNALPNFFCRNCQYQQHQCFICGMLGSSDVSSSNAEVFPCVTANCGRFYHPKCVAAKLQMWSDMLVEDLEQKIAGGEAFACPAHWCFVCKQLEDRQVIDMQFAICRRCPKSYHRKCLPREITFGNDYEKNIFQRAWDDLLPKRVLIYCLDHEIDPALGTPDRHHLSFPDSDEEKTAASENSGNDVCGKRKWMPSQSSAENVRQRTAKQDDKIDVAFGESQPARLAGNSSWGPALDSQRKRSDNSASALIVHDKTFPRGSGSLIGSGGKQLHEYGKFAHARSLGSYSQKPEKAGVSCKKLYSGDPVKDYSRQVSDSEVEKRILTLMADVESSFDFEEFKKSQIIPSNYKYTQDVDRNLTKGTVDGAVKAIRTALQKLRSGGTVDDAKAVCNPETLQQIPVWKRKLEVYLQPFFHGNRYTSYGRHFTILEKLQEVVDRLHWYVEDGDTIVDFCCGANDFSRLMKAKLDSVGKKCSFKNYDLFPPKHLFEFEERDWFTVTPSELPPGSKLIMGLNPPFGYKAELANKFINHAVEFNPKLLILIAPPETRRLDRRNDGNRYELIWEDRCLLSGKSFYLPGSVDVHDKQALQWNNKAPLLSLWSHPKRTRAHMAIARTYQTSLLPANQVIGRTHQQCLPLQPQRSDWNYLDEDQHDCQNEFSDLLMNQVGGFNHILPDVPGANYQGIPGQGQDLGHSGITLGNTSSNPRMF